MAENETNKDVPGISGHTFKLNLNKNYFKNTIETPTYFEYTVKLIGEKRHQWYWRVLHYLTFKKYFDIEYILQIIDGPNLIME